MKRLLAPLALLPLFVIFNFTACSDDGSSAAAGPDPILASCQHAALCDPIELPSFCASNVAAIDCSRPDGGAPGDGGAEDGGGADDAGAADGGADGGMLSPLQAKNLQCTLEALRDRRAGGLTVLAAYDGSKTCGTRIEIVSFGDGTASVLPVGYCDSDVVRGKAVRRQIKPTSFFEECLSSTDEQARLDCLAGATTANGALGETCSCRGIASDPIRGECSSDL